MARLGWSKDTIADRISLTLPDKFAKDESSNIWKLLRSLAEVFSISTDGIDELFLQTNLTTATGEFLDEYVHELTELKRKSAETDAELRSRFFRNVFTYNGTRNGIKEITYDVMGHYPIALIDKDRGAFNDAEFYYNNLDGGAHYGGGTQPYVGYIILRHAPTSAQMDELCAIINRHKALGIIIYIKYRKYDIYTGYSYTEIAELVTDQSVVKQIGPAAYGDFYNARGFYNDTNYPAIYGAEDETGYDAYYVYLKEEPIEGVLDELLESLSENLEPGDQLYVVYPEG